jgi:hypothetical protein
LCDGFAALECFDLCADGELCAGFDFGALGDLRGAGDELVCGVGEGDG